MNESVNHVLLERVKGVAYGDIDEVLKALTPFFAQRKRFANAILKNGADEMLVEFFELMNADIKKALCL